MYFASNLKILRKNNNMSQEELANILNYSFKNVSKWENGLSIPSYDVLVEISKLFNISINELMEEDLSKLNNVKYKSDIISNKNLNLQFQKEIFDFLYTTSTCFNHKIIKFINNNIIFENYIPSSKIMMILRKEIFDLNQLSFLIDYVMKQLVFNGLITYYELVKQDNIINIGYQI